MPPQISEDEASDVESEPEVVPMPDRRVKQENKGKGASEPEEESLMVESESNMDEEEELDDEEYVVEKITNHLVDEAGILRFEVKWEGYDKKADRTWEPEENLETAEKIVSEYLAKFGGREQIMAYAEEVKAAQSAKHGKKRARSVTDVDTPTNGAKRGRKPKLEHPLESTPPASASRKGNNEFTPPTGNWEEEVKDIDACEGTDGKPIVFVTWKSGHKSQHPLPQIYKRCPQKMLQFYERHLVFKRSD